MKRALLPSKAFVRSAQRLTKRNPAAAADLAVALELLAEDAHHPARRTRAIAGGHRAFDILQVAHARLVDPREFFCFNAEQLRIAKAAGLRC